MIVLTKLFRMPRPRGTGRSIVRTVALTAGAVVLFGCHLLDVTNPDIVPASNLTTAAALTTVRSGAIGDFNIAYVGSGASGSSGTVEGQILSGGMLSDELINTETFPDRVQEDARQTDPSSGTFATVFQNLSRARASTEQAALKFRTLSDTTTNAGLTEMLTLSGYTYLMMSEDYCSGVPVSNLDASGKVIYGTPLTTVQLMDTALNRFNQALTAAGALTSAGARSHWQQFANVGIARANLDLGNFAAAATAATAVTDSFVYQTQYDKNTTRENNGVFSGIRLYKRYGVADGEGGVGIKWRSQPDPRTPFFQSPAGNKGLDGLTPQFDQLRYPERDAQVPLATGLEARLINAEAALQAGDTVGYMAALNDPRANLGAAAGINYIGAGTPSLPVVQPLAAGSLAPLTTPTSDTAAINLLFNERARWLWLTGHRLNDLRRLVRAKGTRGGYGLAPNAVWPNGAYFKNGLTYGGDYNLPVPITEQNNPNFTQCLDRLP